MGAVVMVVVIFKVLMVVVVVVVVVVVGMKVFFCGSANHTYSTELLGMLLV